MQGQVLDYSIQTNEGIITTKDGQRYRFEGKEWKEATVPSRGMDVDFDVNENSCAVGVYRALKSSSNALSFGASEPPRVSRRPNFLREYPNEKYLFT